MRCPALAALAALVTLAGASAAGAVPNLLPNPGFDAGVAGWSDPGGGAHVDAGDPDESGKAEGGSLRLRDMLATSSYQTSSDCLAVVPAQPIVFGASGLVAETTGHQLRAVLKFWSNASCSGPAVGFIISDLNRTADVSGWAPVQGMGTVPPGALGATLALTVHTYATAPAAAFFDNAFVYQGQTCANAATVVCLDGGRFRVDVQWSVPDGTRGASRMRGLTAESAYATFFDPGNVELMIKVLDACSYNGRYWVFAGGLTNVAVTARVRDTLGGATWTHLNPLGQPFAPVQDTGAFDTCPH
jgi:hypothetical protein